MERAVITADLLRADANLSFAQRFNVRWMSGLLRNTLQKIGFEVQVLGRTEADFPFSELYELAYASPGEDVPDKWARYFDGTLPDRVQAIIQAQFVGALVCIFEAPPSIIKLIGQMGGTYINFRVHPMRFSSDLVLSLESNNRSVMRRLRRFEMSSDYIDAEIASLKARWGTRPFDLPANSVIFLGQSRFDSSVILRGRFMSLDGRTDELMDKTRGRSVFHKPHPHDPDCPTIEQWKLTFPNSQQIDASFYNIISNDDNYDFVTISSGAGFEAQLLGHKTHYLSPLNWSTDGGAFGHFRNILYEYWYPGFWRYILFGGLPWRIPRTAGFVPDRLRRAIGLEWSLRG